jgi:cell division protein ZapA
MGSSVEGNDAETQRTMEEDKKDTSLVPVVIFGQTYKVRAEENSTYIEDLARYVDTKMKTIAESTGTSEALKVAILAALNIADEFFKLEEAHEASRSELLSTADEVLEVLESSLREPTETSPAPLS